MAYPFQIEDHVDPEEMLQISLPSAQILSTPEMGEAEEDADSREEKVPG